jgi:hypothetical protein
MRKLLQCCAVVRAAPGFFRSLWVLASSSFQAEPKLNDAFMLFLFAANGVRNMNRARFLN